MRHSRGATGMALVIALATVGAWLGLGTAPVIAQSPLSAGDLFDGGTLQDLWIHINALDWAQLRATADENTYYPCDVDWRGLRVNNAGCRSRGAYTRNGIKPGLRVEFDHYVTGQSFLGLTSLVLDNFWQDPSMLKERLAMQLFERMGVAAPREAHARLFVGSRGEYVGVYAIVEDVAPQFLARHFAGGADGYLFEYRWNGPWGLEELGTLDDYALRFEAKTRETESVFGLYAPIRELVRAVNAAQPERLEAALESHLDLRTFLTHAAVENFVSNWDGLLGLWGMNNFYCYRPATTAAHATLIPWDQDNSFIDVEMAPWHNVEGNVLMQKVWESPPLRLFYLQQLVAVGGLSTWLANEIERESALIRDSVAADPVKNSTLEEFDTAVDALRTYVRSRAAIVAQYLGQTH